MAENTKTMASNKGYAGDGALVGRGYQTPSQPGNRKIISFSAPKTERLLVRESLLLLMGQGQDRAIQTITPKH